MKCIREIQQQLLLFSILKHSIFLSLELKFPGFAICTCFDPRDPDVSLQFDVELCEAALDPDGYGANFNESFGESFACLLGSTFDLSFEIVDWFTNVKFIRRASTNSEILRQTVWDF